MANRIRRHKKTGEEVEVDEFNNIIRRIKPGNVNLLEEKERYFPSKIETGPIMSANADDYDMFKRGDPEKKTYLRPSDWKDLFYTDVGRYVRPGLTTAGGIRYGSPGTGVLSYLGGSLQKSEPRMFGNPPENLTLDAVKDMALDKALEYGTKATAFALSPEIRNNITQNFFKKHFGATVDPSLVTPSQFGKNIDLTIGQTNPRAEWIENLFAPEESRAIKLGQQADFTDWMKTKRIDNVEDVLKTTQQKTKGNVNAWRNEYSHLRGEFNPHIANNSMDVEVPQVVKSVGFHGNSPQLVMRKHRVEGAIPLNASKQFADRIGADLEQTLGPDLIKEHSLGTGTGNPLAQLYHEIDKVRGIRTRIDPATGEHMRNPVAAYKDMQALKESIYNFLGDETVSKFHRDRLEGGLKTLAETINKDIDAGIRGWGEEAYTAYRKSQDYYKGMMDKLNPEMAKRMALTGRADYEGSYHDLARKALSDPMQAERFLKLTQDKKTLMNLFMDDMAKAAYDSGTNFYKPDAALDYLLNTKGEVSKKVLNDVYRKNLETYLRKNALVKTPNLNFGNLLNLRRLGKAAGVASGIAYKLGDPYHLGSAGLGLTTGAYLLPKTAREVVKRTFLDPDFAKAVQGVTDIGPATKNVKAKLEAFFNAMRGARIMVQKPTGNWEEEEIQ